MLCRRPDGAQHIGLIRRHVGMAVDDVLPAVDGQMDRTAEGVNQLKAPWGIHPMCLETTQAPRPHPRSLAPQGPKGIRPERRTSPPYPARLALGLICSCEDRAGGLPRTRVDGAQVLSAWSSRFAPSFVPRFVPCLRFVARSIVVKGADFQAILEG